MFIQQKAIDLSRWSAFIVENNVFMVSFVWTSAMYEYPHPEWRFWKFPWKGNHLDKSWDLPGLWLIQVCTSDIPESRYWDILWPESWQKLINDIRYDFEKDACYHMILSSPWFIMTLVCILLYIVSCHMIPYTVSMIWYIILCFVATVFLQCHIISYTWLMILYPECSRW